MQSVPGMRLRTIGLTVAATMALLPAPAFAQGDFVKDKVKSLIEKSGVYVSVNSRTPIDEDVQMGQSFGIGYGTAASMKNGWKYPFAFSTYGGDLETTSGAAFGRFRARQLMTGVGYQWVHGKMILGTQLGVGYSFNHIAANGDAPAFFNTTSAVALSASNSFVLRPQVKAEYFVSKKFSLRTQLSYTYTNPDVVVTIGDQRLTRDWRPQHMQLSAALGYFPFKKR